MTDITTFYSKKVLDHFYHPRNMGEIKNPDGHATVGNPICGDVMRMFISVGHRAESKEEYVKGIKFQTLGCGAAIATSSMVTEMAKGKTLKEAEKIDKKKVIDSLGGLPPAKLHCSVLAVDALQKAIANYRKRGR